MRRLLWIIFLPLSINALELKKETGIASYYANCLNGRATACGEPYNTTKLTAAHKTLPFGTIVEVTMVSTGRQVIVKINDRGPYSKRRVIDLSYKAAQKIGLVRAGIGRVRLKILD
jgi:rare lipoprotein A